MTSSQFSCFAPSGIRFTRRASTSKLIYEQLREGWGSLFSDDPEATVNVETFAQARCLAVAREQLQRAGNQANPRHVTELMPKLEADYKLVPRPGATRQERRAALIAARVASRGATLAALTAGLTALLGDLLIAIVPQPMGAVGSGGMYPDTRAPDAGPGAFKPLGAEFKVVRLTTHSLGASVGYEHVAGYTTQLIAGDRLTVNPGKTGLIETVTLTTATASEFTATFTKPHSAGDLATTASVPYWVTGRKFLYVVAADAAFDDAVLLAQVNDYLRKTLGHATGWAIVHEHMPASSLSIVDFYVEPKDYVLESYDGNISEVFYVGRAVRCVALDAPSLAYNSGTVTAYSAPTLTVLVSSVYNPDEYSDSSRWSIIPCNVTGAVGAAGPFIIGESLLGETPIAQVTY